MKGAVLQWYSTFFERRNHRMSTKGKKGWIIAFVLPCVVLFCLVYAIPFIMVITTSFCNYTLTQAPAFQGLENFKIIIHCEYIKVGFDTVYNPCDIRFCDGTDSSEKTKRMEICKSCLCDSEYHPDGCYSSYVFTSAKPILWNCQNDL